MSITNDLIELNGDKSDIQDALVAKGVTSAAKHGFNKFAEDISTIYTFTPTQAQLDAMNSGIDSTKVGQIATNASDISSLTTAVSAKIGAADYATQNTGGTVRAWTTTDGTSTTLHIATEAPSP